MTSSVPRFSAGQTEAATKPPRTKKCDGCGRRRETEEWRLRSMAAGEWCQADLCGECAAIPQRVVNKAHDPDVIRPVAISALKPTPGLRRQQTKRGLA